jgi:hypothetical protein
MLALLNWIGWGDLAPVEQRIAIWCQGAAVGLCGGVCLRRVCGTLFGGLSLGRRPKPKARKRRRR